MTPQLVEIGQLRPNEARGFFHDLKNVSIIKLL